MNIYIGNLSKDVSDDDLRKAFEVYGEVSSVKVIRDIFTQESKGFGFVEMPEHAKALEAISGLNNQEVKGKRILVNEARPRRDKRNKRRHGRGGGGYSGRGGGYSGHGM